MPLQATSGAASYDAFGGGVPVVPNYIEDVFNSYLWTTIGSDQTFTTGIDMTKGALTWIKGRSNAFPHILQTGIGGGVLPNNALSTNSTAAYAGGNFRIADSTTGFTMGVDYYTGTPETAVVWTFREQPKFFDVVTWTGNNGTGSGIQTIAHNLGSVPGTIIVKCIDTAPYDWIVYHRSLGATKYAYLNTTAAADTFSGYWNNTEPTSTQFTVGTSGGVNGSGQTYVAYVFAHDAGGFGLTGTDNVISCGSYTGTGATGNNVTLGYEPQWLMIKAADRAQDWFMFDVMRGMTTTGGTEEYLLANSSGAAGSGAFGINPTATGFGVNTAGTSFNASGEKYIYIAIRRGPMKVPTSGTSVFKPVTFSFDSFTTAGFPVDFLLSKQYNDANSWRALDRLRGTTPPSLFTNSTSAESNEGLWRLDNSTGVNNVAGGTITGYENWMFKRAPSFCDVVCYTGTGSSRTLNHNLGVAPELMIVKCRSTGGTNRGWWTYVAPLGNTQALYLNGQDNAQTAGIWNYTTPTSTVFSIDGTYLVNGSGATYVAYLFATCAGVSKVGSYTGNGTTQTINCGFTGGARFVLIKRTDSTGDWMVSDSARGIVSGNDPYLELNNTNAEVTGEDWLDTDSTGFVVNEVSGSNANTSSATYIFLAIA